MVRPAHHPELSRRANPKFKFSNDQNTIKNLYLKKAQIFLFKAFEFLSFDIVSTHFIKSGDIRYSDF